MLKLVIVALVYINILYIWYTKRITNNKINFLRNTVLRQDDKIQELQEKLLAYQLVASKYPVMSQYFSDIMKEYQEYRFNVRNHRTYS